MSTMGDIEAAIDALEAAGTPRDRITVLQCNTEYPTPPCDVNLRAMESIRTAFGVGVGYSDHTAGIEVAIAAVALGATIIEKHITLDRSLPGPDHQASLEPAEFLAMVSAIRNIELALGDGIKRPTASERHNMRVARKSIVAACDIAMGERFTADNLAVMRPADGLSPMLWDDVLRRTATRAYTRHELI
jgi:N,N'-diacetyllegionaminate synthase